MSTVLVILGVLILIGVVVFLGCVLGCSAHFVRSTSSLRSDSFTPVTKETVKETYRVPKENLHHPVEMHFDDDEYAVGIKRPLWGPLKPLEKKSDAYLKMIDMPWCFTTMTQYPMCEGRTCADGECRLELPYTMDKI